MKTILRWFGILSLVTGGIQVSVLAADLVVRKGV